MNNDLRQTVIILATEITPGIRFGAGPHRLHCSNDNLMENINSVVVVHEQSDDCKLEQK